MIFFYQVRALEHKTVQCPDVPCPLCRHTGDIVISIRQKYTWFLGPMAPSRKFGVAHCGHCGKLIPNVKWNRELEQAYRGLKATVRTPLRLWRGMLVLPCIILLIVAGGSFVLSLKGNDQQRRARLIKEYVEQPQPGDLYQLIVPGRNGNTNCSYAKYIRTSGDTVFVFLLNKLNPSTAQWNGLDTQSLGAFDSHEFAASRQMLEQDMLVSSIINPVITMTVWGIERNGKLVKRF